MKFPGSFVVRLRPAVLFQSLAVRRGDSALGSHPSSVSFRCPLRSFDLNTNGGDGIGVYHLVDFRATSDYYEVEIHLRICGSVQHCCSGAIWIYGICPCAGLPVLRGREPTYNDVVNLCDVAFSIVMLHDHAADRQVWAH